ncbi:MAG: glutamate 5-kinase [Desulfobacterales bacterium]
MIPNRNAYLSEARRIVVKVGSNVLTAESGLNLYAVRNISRQICRLIDQGKELLLVTSGAMAAGISKVGLSRRPDRVPQRQAVSAVGQAGLIMEYEHAFDRYGIKVAQVLMTSDGINNRRRYLNARNTLNTLLGWGIVPIINENDTVAVESIQFGDNDTLAATISLLMDADLLINLTDIDGLFDKDPRIHADARLIPQVDSITAKIKTLAGGLPGALGTGGMSTKIKAARRVMSAGIPMIIANGAKGDTLIRIFQGAELGTFFLPKAHKLASRKSWIGFSVKPEGLLKIDSGAARAIRDGGKSLLPSGITAVEGDFPAGVPVALCTIEGRQLATGLVNYRAGDIRKIMGRHSRAIAQTLGDNPYDEVVHRDNLVITEEDAESAPNPGEASP